MTTLVLLFVLLSGCDLWVQGPAPCDPGGQATAWFVDADGDGFGDPDRQLDCEAIDEDVDYVSNADDCDDSTDAIHPEQAELCDGVDNDCSGEVDDGLATAWLDADGDGYGDLSSPRDCATWDTALEYVNDTTDCDDDDASIHPGAQDVCDGLDNDCSGVVDEGFEGRHLDADVDGFGDPDRPLECASWDGETDHVDNDIDCDDSTFDVESEQRIWYLDEDQDGYGTGEDCELDDDGHWLSGEGCVEVCAPPEGYGAPETGDCAPENSSWSLICPWAEVVAGEFHTCARRESGDLQCWGEDNDGQASPPADTDFIQLTAGDAHSCGLHDGGRVSCWGEGEYGEADAPAEVDFVQISAGTDRNCGVRADGSISCWGDVSYSWDIPPEDTDFQQVAVGSAHACGLHDDGSVSCWGYNFSGSTRPPSTSDFQQITAHSYHSCGLHDDGSVSCWGSSNFGQASPPPLTDLVEVSTGGTHSCGRHEDGSVTCWGSNSLGQGRPLDNADFLGVSAGGYHSCGVHTDGSISCWGRDDEHQTTPFVSEFRSLTATPNGTCASNGLAMSCWGEPDTPPTLSLRVDSLDTATSYACGLRADGSATCWGDDALSAANPPDYDDLLQISTSWSHACALREAGTISCWGTDSWYAHYPPSGSDFIQISTASSDSCGLHGDGQVSCSGYDHYGEASPPADADLLQFSQGSWHACGVHDDGHISCWGMDDGSSLDLGQVTDTPGGTDFVQVSAGGLYSCAVLNDGHISCWGDDSDGQASPPSGAGFTQVDAGYNHSCAVHESGSISCWGTGDHGEASPPSDQDFAQVSVDDYMSCGVHEDHRVSCWGDDRDQKTTPHFGRGVVSLQGGDGLLCAMLDTADLICGGDGDLLPSAAVPPSRMSMFAVGRRHGCAVVEESDALYCWGDDSSGQATAPEDLGAPRGLAAGGTFTCALDQDGAPWCWGDIEDPPEGLTPTQLAAGYAHACGLDTDGLAVCWGDDGYNQLTPPEDTRFSAIFAGGWTSCGLLAETGDAESGYQVACWGDDSYGQVRAAPPYVRFHDIVLGDDHVCGLKPDGLLSCWGSDRFGQLDWPLPSELE